MPNTTPSQDFLNAVCTHTMWLANGTIKYYGGNYAKFVATVEEEERLQLRVYEKQQADMDKLEKFVEVNRANGVANSAKSKKKVLGKLQDEAVERPLIREPSLVFSVSASECPLIAFLIKAQHEKVSASDCHPIAIQLPSSSRRSMSASDCLRTSSDRHVKFSHELRDCMLITCGLLIDDKSRPPTDIRLHVDYLSGWGLHVDCMSIAC